MSCRFCFYVLKLIESTCCTGALPHRCSSTSEGNEHERCQMARMQSEMTQTILRSWQEIANYIGRTPRTVQRWEHHFGMPVHRKQMLTGRTVFAFAHELESWLRSVPSKRARVQQPPHLRVPCREQQMDCFLNSWKDVARFVGISVRTVQRWERHAGLPVHRPARKLRSPIVAIPEEVERWLNQERSTPNSTAAGQPPRQCRTALPDQASNCIHGSKA